MTLDDLKKLKEEDYILRKNEIIKLIATTNNRKYNLTKLAEELNELSTVILQTANKNKEIDFTHIIEEIGDVHYRLEIALATIFVNKEITEKKIVKRYYFKLKSSIKNLITGKYLNNV